MPDDEIERRRAAMEASPHPWQPHRDREVSDALKLYGATALSANKGAARDVKGLLAKLGL